MENDPSALYRKRFYESLNKMRPTHWDNYNEAECENKFALVVALVISLDDVNGGL